ncbi:unnamed protein product [Penicillium pancosmium]
MEHASETYDFTIWSCCASSNLSSEPSSSSENGFSSKKFEGNAGTNLVQQLSIYLDQVANSAVGIIQIDKYSAAMDEALQSYFPKFPKHILKKVNLRRTDRQDLPEIPSANKDAGIPSNAFSYTGIEYYQIATWILQAPGGGQTIESPSPLAETNIWLFCTNHGVPKRLSDHYFNGDNSTRWVRLQNQPLWIFADILHVFGDWTQVLNGMSQKLGKYHRQIYHPENMPPLRNLTRELHNEAADVQWLRKQLRVHSAALTRLIYLNACVISEDSTQRMQYLAGRRLQAHLEDIQYHEETSQDVIRQLENMINLVILPPSQVYKLPINRVC